MTKHDLSAFDALKGRKTPWPDRYSLAKEIFPSVENLDWQKLFRLDPTVAGEIINDINKASDAAPKRPGKRASVDRETAALQLKKLMGEDYSLEAFDITFKAMIGKRSIRGVASKVGIDRNQIYRLLRGEVRPSVYEMETIAPAFGKTADFFLEYRLMYVTAFLLQRIENIPESSVHYYRKIRKIGTHG
jgi:transcriptional regulator with XRE-family HTH domain